jgi:hypothetical protein
VLRGADRQLDVVLLLLDRGADYVNEDDPAPVRIGRVDRHTPLSRTHVAKKTAGGTTWVRKQCSSPLTGGALWLWTVEARLRGSAKTCDGKFAPATFADYEFSHLAANMASLEFEDCLVLRRFTLNDLLTIKTINPAKLPPPAPLVALAPTNPDYGIKSSGTVAHELGRQLSFGANPLTPSGPYGPFAAHRAQWLKAVGAAAHRHRHHC